MRTTLAVSILALVCSASLSAQATAGFGAVTGTIRDSSGDGLPDTTVVLSNDALGLERSVVTTDDGVFDMLELPPSTSYHLKASRKDYANWQTKDFEVFVGQTLDFKILMHTGTAVEQVEAASVLPPVDETKSGVSALVVPQQLEGLPNSARLEDTFVLLAPAVSQDAASGVLSFLGVPSTTPFLTDGSDTTNLYYFQKPGVAPQLTPDAVGELQVLSAVAPAEFGYTMGGVVNAATRNGTNTFHGALYDYYLSHSLMATNRFAPGFKPDDWQHQGGASLGGPIRPGKLFFFANFEVVDGNFSGLNRITNPLIANPLGTAVLPSNCKATAAQCTAASRFIDAQMNVAVPRSLFSLDGLAKIDYRKSDRNNFSIEGNVLDLNSPNGIATDEVAGNGGLLGSNGSYTEQTRYAQADWTSVLVGTGVNDLRGSWFKDRLADYTSQNLLPSTDLLSINVAGTPIGANPGYPSVLSEQRYQLVDTFTATLNSHSVKLGADLSKNEDWLNQLSNRYGTYNYPSLTAFAQDFSGNTAQLKSYTDFTQTFGNPIVDVSTPWVNFYAQDTWKVTRRLTLTYGVRYEKQFFPTPTLPNSTYYQTQTIPSPSIDFSPRVGAAYMVNDRTVVRIGFGFFYQPFPGQLLDELIAGNGVYQPDISVNPNQKGALVFPHALAPNGAIPTGTENVAFANTKFVNPYTQQGSAAVERRLNRNTNLTVSYIYSRGIGLWTTTDTNLNAPTVTANFVIDNASGVKTGTYSSQIWTTKTNTSFAHAYQVNNAGSSQYNGIAIQLQRQMSHGMSLQASYTYTHATDNVSGSPAIAFLPSSLIPGSPQSDQGPSLFDQAHRAVVNWTWQPTVTHSNSVAARYLLNGWQVSGIATLASSLGETPLMLVNGLQGLAMAYTSSLNGSGGWPRVPFESINSLLTGPEYDVDARLTRTLPFTERVTGMLIFEAFNAFNTQYNTSLNTIGYTATAGVLRPVPGVGAGNEASGFPYGTNSRLCQIAFRLVF